MKAIVRFMPATVLLILFVFLWVVAANGGAQGVLAWLTLMGGLPYLGGLVLLGTLVAIGWKRTVNAPLIATLFVASLTIWPAFWTSGVLSMAYPIALARTSPSASVRLPADVPILVAWGGDTPAVNYHVTFPDQRWAYDLVVDPSMTGSDQLDDYGCWGVPVFAPAAGEVIIVHDGERDHVPGRDSTGYTHPGGNHLFIRLETGTFLTLAHLQQDSIMVQEGDWVAEGDTVGNCGNSGSTSEPHIHIHHQRQDPRTTAIGLAEGLPLLFRDHNGQPMPERGQIVQHVAR
jgi:hypothetical protein